MRSTHAPLDEKTLDELREIAGRYPRPRSALLPMLHLVQSVEGRVTSAGIEACADVLGLSAAEVSGVATFYTMYKRWPVGTHLVGVCTNTLCAVLGGDLIYQRLKEHLDLGNDETTEDGAISLEHIECNAACDYAPVVTVNYEFFDNQTPQSAVALVDDLRAGREVHATRGPRLCTWREAERILAGFPDSRVNEGPAAGPATLAGLALARERGWSAPPVEAGPRGRDAERDQAVPAAEQADTTRAESETKVEAAGAEHTSRPGGAEEPGDASSPLAGSGDGKEQG